MRPRPASERRNSRNFENWKGLGGVFPGPDVDRPCGGVVGFGLAGKSVVGGLSDSPESISDMSRRLEVFSLAYT